MDQKLARRWGRGWCRGVLCLGLVSAFATGERGSAQDRPGTRLLSVRPRAMAIGAPNPQAGTYPLSSAPNYLVTVPPICAGAHPCPLFLMLPTYGTDARELTEALRPVAVKYGMLLLAATEDRTGLVDTALTEVLQKFAVDPDKIGVFGRGTAARPAMRLGIDNLNVFNRIGAFSGGDGGYTLQGLDPNNTTVEFFIDGAIKEYQTSDLGNYNYVHLDMEGPNRPVKFVENFRELEPRAEDYDFFGRWLQESWAIPDSAARATRRIVDPEGQEQPELTPAMLREMAAFWTSFMHEPDSIRTTARLVYLQEVATSYGGSLLMTNMPKLAGQYSSVAADLAKAGLTAEQHDRLRLALYRYRTSNPTSYGPSPESPEYMDAYLELWASGMWNTP